MKRVIFALMALALAALVAACDSGPAAQPTEAPQATLAVPTINTDAIATALAERADDVTPTVEVASPTAATQETPTEGAAAPGGSTPSPGGEGRMTIETSKGRIVLSLHTDPSARVTGTIRNFAQKAQAGYFNGLNFHRVEGWVIQGGDPSGSGTGGGTMPAEYNGLPFVAGSLGVARGQDPAINNDSQFFIVKEDSPHLNGSYTNWGKVIEGMDVVNQIAVGDKITSITIEGVDNMAEASNEPQHISVQHILIGFKDAVGFGGNAPPKAAPRTREQAETLANEILNRAKAGEDYDALVAEYTDDSAPGIYGMSNFGVAPATGEYERGGMVPAFGNVGFGLEVGEIAMAEYNEQTSPFGWHIIKRVK